MKKLLFIVGVSMLLANTSNAQENAVKVNPIGLVFGIANAGYEFEVNDSQTVTVSGIYYGLTGISGFGIGGEYRFYLTDDSFRGWHAGPAVGYLGLSEKITDSSSGFFSIGGEGGHQWIVGENIVLDAFIGISVLTGSGNFSTLNTVSPTLGFSVGYAW